ncbi:hypothetical protein Anas_05906, partial [Armadillidium nasatum]
KKKKPTERLPLSCEMSIPLSDMLSCSKPEVKKETPTESSKKSNGHESEVSSKICNFLSVILSYPPADRFYWKRHLRQFCHRPSPLVDKAPLSSSEIKKKIGLHRDPPPNTSQHKLSCHSLLGSTSTPNNQQQRSNASSTNYPSIPGNKTLASNNLSESKSDNLENLCVGNLYSSSSCSSHSSCIRDNSSCSPTGTSICSKRKLKELRNPEPKRSSKSEWHNLEDLSIRNLSSTSCTSKSPYISGNSTCSPTGASITSKEKLMVSKGSAKYFWSDQTSLRDERLPSCSRKMSVSHKFRRDSETDSASESDTDQPNEWSSKWEWQNLEDIPAKSFDLTSLGDEKISSCSRKMSVSHKFRRGSETDSATESDTDQPNETSAKWEWQNLEDIPAKSLRSTSYTSKSSCIRGNVSRSPTGTSITSKRKLMASEVSVEYFSSDQTSMREERLPSCSREMSVSHKFRRDSETDSATESDTDQPNERSSKWEWQNLEDIPAKSLRSTNCTGKSSCINSSRSVTSKGKLIVSEKRVKNISSDQTSSTDETLPSCSRKMSVSHRCRSDSKTDSATDSDSEPDERDYSLSDEE